MYRRAKVREEHPSREVYAARQALAERTLATGFAVPAWVKKDTTLYDKVRRRKFTDQAALDEYLSHEAVRRHRTPTRYESVGKPRQGYTATMDRDVRITQKASIRNKIKDGEFSFA